MESFCRYIGYDETNVFPGIVNDYLLQDQKLKPFYKHPVSLEGIQDAIRERQAFPTNRVLLVEELRKQYHSIAFTGRQEANLEALLQENTFTITTAHQPNIFTGPLYFIYKILHAIKLADELREQLPAYRFVPVYYMGSEDADLDELGHIWLGGERATWQTHQTGAVGRMDTKGLETIIQRLEGEFGDLPFGKEMIALCRNAYSEHSNIQEATLYLVNELFKEYGLLVLIPDNTNLKRAFQQVVKKELLEQFSHKLVQQTIERIGKHYKVQAGGRELNLFYLNDEGKRERIEVRDTRANTRSTQFEVRSKRYEVKSIGLVFSEKEILKELEDHPGRFSANVILRGVFQETILPNIAFIGGGGELAYWLELKEVFEAAGTPYPVLILRNSFLIKEQKHEQLQKKLGLTDTELFLQEQQMMNLLVKRFTDKKLDTATEQQEVYVLYEKLQHLASSIDPVLKAHVAALHVRTLQGLQGLDKKLLRAEKRKQTESLAQVKKMRAALFPSDNLQERIDNVMPLYAAYGNALIEELYKHSLTLEQRFTILTISTA